MSLPTAARLSQNPPRDGLWAGIARAADAPTVGVGDVWRGLERRVAPAARESETAVLSALVLGDWPPPPRLWAALADRTNPALYRPCAVPDVAEETVAEAGEALTVIRSPRGNFLRLNAVEREAWHAMDGSRTVAQIATQSFLRHGQLVPVGELTAALREEGFLDDPPVGVYRSLSRSLAERTPEGWGARALRAFAGRTWPIAGLDRFYGALYRAGGWLLFTRPFLTIAALVMVAGLVAFVVALLGGVDSADVIGLNGSVALGLAALWAALFVSLVLHESAHALAVKHYGRTVLGGGLMLYYGLPAAYIDTSDIWRSPRRARIAVSAAGPAADLLVGSLAALTAVALPETAIGALALKLAITSYASTLFNLNPLLELDGYFMLVDLLRMPDMRRRSFAFIGGELRERAGDRRPQPGGLGPEEGGRRRGVLGRWSFALRHLTREERILALFGVAATLYTLFAAGAAVWVWYRHVLGPALRLIGGEDVLQRLLGWGLMALVVAPAAAAALLAGIQIGGVALGWVLRRGYGRRPALLAGAAALIALLVTLGATGPWWQPVPGGALVWPFAAALLWMFGLAALLLLQPDYRGAAVAPAMLALTATTVLAALAGVLRALPWSGQAWIVADGAGFVFLLLAGFAALLDVDLRFARPRELLATAALLMLAFAVGGAALFGALDAAPGIGPAVALVKAAPAYFGALALALLLPHLFGLQDSRLFWAWGLLWLAALARTAAYVAGVRDPSGTHIGLPLLDVLSAALWAAAWLVHLATLRQIALDEIAWPHEPAVSEAQRLLRAFQWTYAGCYRILRAVYGERRARALDDRMDVLAATANWDVTLDRDRARVGAATQALTLDAQGARFAEVLRYAVGEVEQIAGVAFARRAVQAAYDALPWPERETASRLCFPDTPWARELSGAFGDTHAARLRLLRQVDLFLSCDDEELAALTNGVQEQRVPAGADLMAPGEYAPGMWVIESGEVIGLRGEDVVAELHRGDTFGARELLQDQRSDLAYRAAIGASLLFIPAEEFRALAAERAPHAADALESAAVLQLLERVPIFATLPRNTLRGLALVAEQRSFAARTVVVRQGVRSGVFYVIRQGRAAVLVREPGQDGAPVVRRVAQLGPREFFGELELLRGDAPVANVVSVTPMVALALPHEAVHALLVGDGVMARGLEQIGTGRLMALRPTSR